MKKILKEIEHAKFQFLKQTSLVELSQVAKVLNSFHFRYFFRNQTENLISLNAIKEIKSTQNPTKKTLNLIFQQPIRPQLKIISQKRQKQQNEKRNERQHANLGGFTATFGQPQAMRRWSWCHGTMARVPINRRQQSSIRQSLR